MPLKYYGSYEIYLVITAVVFLLCGLYNAYKLGKFKKGKYAAPGSAALKSSCKKVFLIVLGVLTGVLIGLAFQFIF